MALRMKEQQSNCCQKSRKKKVQQDSLPLHLDPECTVWPMGQRLKNKQKLNPKACCPISHFRKQGQNPVGTFQLSEEYRLCLPLNHGCCNMPGILGACAAQARWKCAPYGHPLPGMVVEDRCSKAGTGKLLPAVDVLHALLLTAH